MSTARLLRACTAFAASIVAAVVPGSERAEAGRVVVLSVAGEGGIEFEDILAGAVSDEHSVIDSRDFEAAARRADIDGFEPEQLGQVAGELDADVVLDPLLTHDRRKNVLTVRIRGRDGRLWRRMTVTIAARKLGRGGIRALRERLLAEIDTLLAEQSGRDDRRRRPDAPAPARDRADRGRPAVRDRDDRADRAPAVRRDRVAVRPADDDGDDPDYGLDGENPLDDRSATDAAFGTGEDDRGETAGAERELRGRAPATSDPRRSPLLLDAGPVGINRTLTFNSQDFGQAPRGYRGAFVPGARVAGELYPIGFANRRSPAAGLGFYGEYAQVLKLTTRSTEAPDKALPTQQLRWEVGLRFRYAFGARPNLPSLVLSVGLGRRAFQVDRARLAGATLDLPDVDYRVITPGLSLRLPLGTPRFALFAGGRFLAVRSAGAIQSVNEYGAATLTGYDAEAGFDVVITRNLVLKGRGEMSVLGYDFSGNGALSRNRDLDPADQDVFGAADRWISASATLGFMY